MRLRCRFSLVSPQTWQPDPAADRGAADPDVRAALASAYADRDAYLRAIVRLCTARLILPTVEAPPDARPGVSKRDGHDDHDGDVDADAHEPRAAVLLRSASGEQAVLAFTGMDALRAWNPAAHPVRCTLDDVAATVDETESSSILVDVAGPHQLVIGPDAVAELARGRRLVELDAGGFGWLFLAESGSTDHGQVSH